MPGGGGPRIPGGGGPGGGPGGPRKPGGPRNLGGGPRGPNGGGLKNKFHNEQKTEGRIARNKLCLAQQAGRSAENSIFYEPCIGIRTESGSSRKSSTSPRASSISVDFYIILLGNFRGLWWRTFAFFCSIRVAHFACSLFHARTPATGKRT